MVDKDILQSIRTAIENPDPDETVKAVEKAVDSGVAPLEIVGALTDGITTLGDKFERMECFLPELILGADAMDASMKLLKPKMEELNLEAGPAGTVVISNIQGDIHDIGRDICIYVACDEPPAVMRGHLREYRVGVRAYEEAGRLLLVDAYEEEESKERHFIANQYSLEKYAVLESNLLERFTDRRVRLVVDSLSTLLIPFGQEEILEFHRSRLKSLRRKGILTMDVFVGGVLDERVMTIISHLYNVNVRMMFGGPKARPERLIQVGKVKSGMFDAVPRRFGIGPVFGIIFAPDVEV
jgi:hypothetical protein